MKKGKILYISQEISPYLPASTISDLGRAIPQAMHERGYEVRTFMPRYGIINERRNQLHEVIRLSGMNIVIDDTDHPLIIKVASLQPSRMQVYFIDSEDYFHRSTKGKETETSPEDNDERAIFFTRGVLETVKRLRWEPAIIQCSGWITSLASIYIRRHFSDDPSYRNSKLVFALLNDRFDNTLDPRFVEKLKAEGFDDSELAVLGSQPVGYDELMKLAIQTADAIVQIDESVDESLIALAKESGKPFLPFQGSDDIIEASHEFYQSLLDD